MFGKVRNFSFYSFFAVSTLWVSVNIVMPILQNNFPNKSGKSLFHRIYIKIYDTSAAYPLRPSSLSLWFFCVLVWIKSDLFQLNLVIKNSFLLLATTLLVSYRGEGLKFWCVVRLELYSFWRSIVALDNLILQFNKCYFAVS